MTLRTRSCAIAAALALLVGGCIAVDAASPVGEWETGPTLSQLGRIVTYYHFRKDGTFTSTVTFIDLNMRDMTVEGTYRIKGKEIDLTMNGEPISGTFRIENDELTLIMEGRDVFAFFRK